MTFDGFTIILFFYYINYYIKPFKKGLKIERFLPFFSKDMKKKKKETTLLALGPNKNQPTKITNPLHNDFMKRL